jgi:hypothetical protein
MRKALVSACSSVLLGLCVYLQAEPSRTEDDTVKIRVRLVDAEGRPIDALRARRRHHDADRPARRGEPRRVGRERATDDWRRVRRRCVPRNP